MDRQKTFIGNESRAVGHYFRQLCPQWKQFMIAQVSLVAILALFFTFIAGKVHYFHASWPYTHFSSPRKITRSFRKTRLGRMGRARPVRAMLQARTHSNASGVLAGRSRNRPVVCATLGAGCFQDAHIRRLWRLGPHRYQPVDRGRNLWDAWVPWWE